MNLIDTHIHLTDEKYLMTSSGSVILETPNYIKNMISFGTNLQDSLMVKTLSEEHDKIYFGAGVHPHSADEFNERQLLDFKKLYDHKKCAVVGEIGLDYHYSYSSKNNQIKVFKIFLDLANEYKLPVSVHSRSAEREVYNILKNYPYLKVVCHSYTGDIKTLEDLISLGMYFSINGMITFKNNNNIVEILKRIPENKLLLETDGPYLAPTPYRGKLNRPEYIIIIAEKIAEVLRKSVEEISIITTKNAQEVFFCDIQNTML